MREGKKKKTEERRKEVRVRRVAKREERIERAKFGDGRLRARGAEEDGEGEEEQVTLSLFQRSRRLKK